MRAGAIILGLGLSRQGSGAQGGFDRGVDGVDDGVERAGRTAQRLQAGNDDDGHERRDQPVLDRRGATLVAEEARVRVGAVRLGQAVRSVSWDGTIRHFPNDPLSRLSCSILVVGNEPRASVRDARTLVGLGHCQPTSPGARAGHTVEQAEHVAGDRPNGHAGSGLRGRYAVMVVTMSCRDVRAGGDPSRVASKETKDQGFSYASRPIITPSTCRDCSRACRGERIPPFSTIVSSGNSCFRRWTCS